MDLLATIALWKADGYGIADTLRCVAMVVQDDHPEVSRRDYIDACVASGYKAKTAECCWSFVARQEA